ncbi:transmembrane protein 39A [Pectinophora gossypiella]|nr:transmembrane protein 39A [Pectinophora gossypiella]
MSCTENESGPFVVFFLPAVVGCLTILLARRWANSQVCNTSSTAVSRRRKIIKDPLVKRPLPPIACKMVPPGTKKASGVKKGAFPVPEEEMNGGTKRVRSTRLPSATGGLEGTLAPKHIPFPYIPQDGELLFEAMTFVFTLVASGLQFLNLYRTVWWLPHSHTNQAMNFYLMEPHLVAFIVALLSRRCAAAAARAALRALLPPAARPHAHAAAGMFILGVVLGAMAWCAYFIYLKYPPVKIFYLLYPAIIYFMLFGFQASPFLELHNGDPPLHCCSHDPCQIRTEVEALRLDFNMRVKKILFNSVAGAYYSSFVPLCFAQSYLYYDVYSASQQVAFVWGGLFGRYCSQLLSAAYCDISHRASKHLENNRPDAILTNGNSGWTEWRVWTRGSILGPDEAQFGRFYAVFANPSMLLCMLLCLQLSLIALQLCLLFSSIPWHNFLSIVILIFINYYTLFKMVRDYLVAWKVYKAENMIQEKNYGLNYPQN